MSEFQDKYKLTETQFTALIKDGWLSCSIPMYEKIVYHYRQSKSMQKTADELGVSKSEVAYVIKRFSVQ